jgi:hypothetical protein
MPKLTAPTLEKTLDEKFVVLEPNINNHTVLVQNYTNTASFYDVFSVTGEAVPQTHLIENRLYYHTMQKHKNCAYKSFNAWMQYFFLTHAPTPEIGLRWYKTLQLYFFRKLDTIRKQRLSTEEEAPSFSDGLFEEKIRRREMKLSV